VGALGQKTISLISPTAHRYMKSFKNDRELLGSLENLSVSSVISGLERIKGNVD
jgi:hypothetical protein